MRRRVLHALSVILAVIAVIVLLAGVELATVHWGGYTSFVKRL
jgi:hypothetical protein